jgi:zinc protease
MSLLSPDMAWGLDLLEDVVKNPVFDEKEFSKEKDKVRTTLHGKQDDISWTTYQALRETLFKTHPFRLEPLGSLDSIEHITAKDARNFYEQFLAPSNMVLTVFGKFDKAQVLQALKSKFSSLKDKKVSIKTFEESPPQKTQENSLTMDKKQAMVAIAFQAPGFYSQDRYGIEVMTSILGSPFSGRIFNHIRDEFGEAYTLGGSYTPGRDMGLMNFFVLTTPESVEKVKGLLEKIIAELAEQPVSDQELSEIKTYLKGSFAMDTETNAQLSFISGLDELYGLGYNHYQSYSTKIDQVTKEDIQRLARDYLDLKKAAVVVTQAKSKP